MLNGAEKMSNEQLLVEVKKQEDAITIYENVINDLEELVFSFKMGERDASSVNNLANNILEAAVSARNKVGSIRSGNPFYGKVIRIKEDVNHEVLEESGYTFNIMEAGYISTDRATIVMTHRNGQTRKVVQYRPEVTQEHVRNVQELINLGMIEELN